MPDQLQLRGGTTVEHSTFIGASKEVTVDTTKKTVVVHDGTTAGGIPVMREDASNSALGLGSAGTPSIKFTGDLDTGIYSPGANQVAISTNGSERMRLTSAGLLGLGTSSPDELLNVNGNIALDTAVLNTPKFLQFRANSNGTGSPSYGGITWYNFQWDATKRAEISSGPDGSVAAGYLAFSTGTTGITERMRISAAGLVGIGTTVPGTLLDVVGSGNPTLTIRGSDGAYSGIFNIQSAGGGSSKISATGGTNSLSFDTNSIERARIDTSGRLLVGTSSARSNFFNTSTVSPALQVEGITDSTAALSLVHSSSSSIGGPLLILGKQKSGGAGGNAIVPDGSQLGIISFQGCDGSELVAGASIEAWTDSTTGANDMPGRLVFSVTADGAASPTERMRIKSTGIINFSNAPTYADNTAATAGGLAVGDVYKTVLGVLMIRF